GSSALVFRYTVQSGDLDTDGLTVGTLALNGGTLKDGSGNDATLTLNNLGSTSGVLVDGVAPTISGVTVPASGNYKAGDNLDFTINYNENVVVNTAVGTPQVSLVIGNSTVQAAYVSGGGSSALVFRYTVQSGDLDTDALTEGTIAINGATLKDGSGNHATLILNSLGSTRGVLIDGVVPTSSSQSSADEASAVSISSDLVISFSEPVSVGSGDILIKKASDNSTVQTIAVTNGLQVTVAGAVVTINPASNFEYSTAYYIQIAPTAFMDAAGNAYAGIAGNSTWNFTTTNPILSSVNDVVVTEGNTGTTNLVFTVSLSEPALAGGASVDYATSNGTAEAGNDYTAASGTLVFAAGESSKTITVSVMGDAIVEADETVSLTLSNANGTNVVISDATAVGTITNDDAAMVTIANASGYENNGAIALTVMLDKAVQGGFSVDVSTMDGSASTADNDYTPIAAQTLAFTGTVGEMHTFNLNPTADTKLETDESLTIALNNLSPDALTVDVSRVATVTILDDDQPLINLLQGVTAIGNGGTYDFGNEMVNSSTDVVFTIENQGMGALSVTTPLGVSGADAADFSIQQQPLSTVAPPGSTSFVVRFSPSSIGPKTVQISLVNNSLWSNPYTLTIQGTGIDIPVLQTTALVTGLYSADLGGTVSSDGATSITESGIVYSATNMVPVRGDVATSSVVVGSGMGTFSQAVSGLSAGQTYYVRAYATNAAGTGYGNVISFRTISQLQITDPVVLAKTYDGTTSATVASLGVLSGIVNGNDVGVTATAEFDNATAGTGKTVTVTYTLSGADQAYYLAPPASILQTGVINKAMLTFIADAQSKRYGEVNPALTYQSNGWVNAENEAVLTTMPSISTSVNTASPAGTYNNSLSLGGASGDNYDFMYTAGTFTVNKAPQSIVFDEDLTRNIEADADFNLSATTTSGLPVTYTYTYTATTAPATVSPAGEVSLKTSGTVEITASQAGNENYLAAEPVTRSLSIESSDPSIWQITINGITYTNPEKELSIELGCGDEMNLTRVTYTKEANASADVPEAFSISTSGSGTFTQLIHLSSQDGSQTATYSLTIEKPFDYLSYENFVVQKFDNVLLVNNQPETNGGYRFTAYRWYRNGILIGTGQYYSAGDNASNTLDPSALYYVEMTGADGVEYRTCEFLVSKRATAYTIQASPSPAKAGSVVRISTTYDPDMLSDLKLQVNNLYGMPLLQKAGESNQNELVLPAGTMPGVYVISTKAGGVVLSTKIIVQ
ncbi:MAG: Calx-beta domain-containing protein, partial [Mangrovibacterium sp.]